MAKPVVGVMGSAHLLNDRFMVHMTGERNLTAVAEVSDALPLVIPSLPDVVDIGALLDIVDGILLTGARANVHPDRFGVAHDPSHEPYDEGRDEVALALTLAAIERGIPVFGICRGMQELAVAYGATLHPEIRDVAGHMNHRAPRIENGDFHPDPEVVFADRHEVRFVPGGAFAKLYDCEMVRVNSLHGQAVVDAGPRVVIEGRAEDSTVEAISIKDASGFALGVQWHAEYDPQTNPVNRLLFEAFGKAIRAKR